MTDFDDNRWRVRVRNLRMVFGAGIYLGDGRVLTCAHVVNHALGLPESASDCPTDRVEVDFPFTAGFRTTATVLPDQWHPVDDRGGGDVAVLRLDIVPPHPVRSARLMAHGRRGSSVHVYGHPHGHDNGIEAESLISGYGGPGGEWVQLDAARTR
jgi:hypothetical protein